MNNTGLLSTTNHQSCINMPPPPQSHKDTNFSSVFKYFKDHHINKIITVTLILENRHPHHRFKLCLPYLESILYVKEIRCIWLILHNKCQLLTP